MAPHLGGLPDLENSLNSILKEVDSADHAMSWQSAMGAYFGVTTQNILKSVTPLVGKYAYYRNIGDDRGILKSQMEIFEYDTAVGYQPVKVIRSIQLQQKRVSDGFVFPLHEKFVIVAKIGNEAGMFVTFLDKPKFDSDNCCTGIMISNLDGFPIFATKVVIAKLKGNENTENWGVINIETAEAELGIYTRQIDNTVGERAVMTASTAGL
jgi:hypothetical protein